VLESAKRGVIGVEVKVAASVNVADFKGLRRLPARWHRRIPAFAALTA
jgi:hypothetical protein